MKTLWRHARLILMYAAACGIIGIQAKESALALLGPQFEKELSEQAHQLHLAYPDLKGSVVLAITIDKSGWVAIVEAKESRLDDTEPLAGILEKAHKWKFSPLNIDKKKTTVEYEIVFSDEFDSTRVFFVVMAAIIVTITGLIILVRIG